MDLLIILGDIGIKTSTEFIKSVKISHIKACHPLVFHGTKPALYLGFLGWRIWLVIVYSRADILELERRVSIDCVVTIDHIEYEVDYRFAKQRVKLRYSPDMESIYVVEADGTLTPIRLLNKVQNADIKQNHWD